MNVISIPEPMIAGVVFVSLAGFVLVTSIGLLIDQEVRKVRRLAAMRASRSECHKKLRKLQKIRVPSS